MTLDPYSVTLLSGAGGAVAAEFFKKAWNSGERWLNKYFQEHQPEAQEKAKENALDFLVDLGNRIQKLENAAEDDSIIKNKLETALSDPDFSAILKDAILFSSRTSSEEKHSLIARVVSERLLSESGSIESAMRNMSIEAIFHLSSDHLRLLAITCFMETMEPSQAPSNLQEGEYKKWWAEWFIKHIKALMPKGEVLYFDYIHLVSVSCAALSPLSIQLKDIISNNSKLNLYDVDLLKEYSIGLELLNLWNEGIKQVRLTSIGYHLGVYVIEEIFDEEIDFKFRKSK
ncbi:MAG: hypothetical protein Q8N97_11150 [Methanobacteriaceae archaeon]|nr:hypothetical protein [Methanobacteriaceae archaeon]MDP3035390.1 hypothetical protein [Methanobacteriaceae archaeon]MDP3622425.1 hypothetical protein [Methanobacteriaceae archaeon]